VQLKLDELIRSVEGAHNGLLDIEELSERDLDRVRGQYEQLARKASEERKGLLDRNTRGAVASHRPASWRGERCLAFWSDPRAP
jgi:low affinity Fe/Cu permease